MTNRPTVESTPDGSFLSFTRRPLIMLESPFGSPDDNIMLRNILYAKECLLDSIIRKESPLAGHLLFTQVLKDREADQRLIGMECHLSWLTVADGVAFYIDHGMSPGMLEAKAAAEYLGIQTVDRHLYNDTNIKVLPDVENLVQGAWTAGFPFGIWGPKSR